MNRMIDFQKEVEEVIEDLDGFMLCGEPIDDMSKQLIIQTIQNAKKIAALNKKNKDKKQTKMVFYEYNS